MSEQRLSLALGFLKTHPDSAAKVLEQHPQKSVADFIISIPHTHATPVLERMLPHRSARLLEHLNVEQTTALLMHLQTTQIVAILRILKKAQRTAILRELPKRVQLNCRLLLNYSTEMVGAWMTPHAITLPHDSTVGEAIDFVRSENDFAHTQYAYVIDRDRYFKGRIHLSDLLKASPNVSLSALTQGDVKTITARSLIYRLVKDPQWNLHEAIPVLNNNGRFVGVLRHIDLRQYLHKPAENHATNDATDAPLTGLLRIYTHCLKALMLSMKECIESDIRS